MHDVPQQAFDAFGFGDTFQAFISKLLMVQGKLLLQ
jgi:hypothetical protein